MTTLEVAEKKWEQFCQRIGEFCQGAMVSIQVVEPNGARKTVVQRVPLVRVALDENSDPCNTRLVIEAGSPGERPVQHVVIEPIHIRLKNGQDNDRYNHLHIIAENGTTIIELNPGINPGLLKGFRVVTHKVNRAENTPRLKRPLGEKPTTNAAAGRRKLRRSTLKAPLANSLAIL